MPMEFYSCLFPSIELEEKVNEIAPKSLKDLHLDQLFGYIFQEKYEYDLKGFFYTPLKNLEVISYRQSILKDLLKEDVRALFTTFSLKTGYLKRKMDNIRGGLPKRLEKEKNYLVRGELLESAYVYVCAIEDLILKLDSMQIESKGLVSFKEYISEYAKDPFFIRLKNEVTRVKEIFNKIQYNLYIKGTSISLFKYDNEKSLTDEITALFDKFHQDGNGKPLPKLKPEAYNVDMENNIMAMMAKVYHEEFKELEKFCTEFKDFDNKVLLRFSKEIQFYLSWYEITEMIRNNGMSFTIPKVTLDKGHMYINDFYDCMLAFNLSGHVVPNSIRLDSPEHILVITGPNQGGKTTFARAFGQAHYLASLGLDIPGSDACIYLIDQVLTHFEVEESIETLNGKLEDELERLYELKEAATKDSVILINEIFASTTVEDAVKLGVHMMKYLEDLGAIAIVVTFLDELATLSSHEVSLMTEVAGEEDHTRTFKIVRKAPDGRAFAMDIAKKYGLSKEDLERRLAK